MQTAVDKPKEIDVDSFVDKLTAAVQKMCNPYAILLLQSNSKMSLTMTTSIKLLLIPQANVYYTKRQYL